MNDDNHQTGFTVIEMLVTVIVAAMFAFMFYQLFISSARLNDVSRRDAAASEIAYSNLKKYPNAASITGTANCASPAATVTVMNTSNSYPDVGTVTETVTGSWPFACTNPDIVRLESRVSYKNSTRQVNYVNYLN